MTTTMKQSSFGRFSIKLTASTDARTLRHRLEKVSCPIQEVEVQIDASFIRISPILPTDSRMTEEHVRSPWQYQVLETLGRGLGEMRKLTILGPYSTSTPVTVLTKLLQAQSDTRNGRPSLSHLTLERIHFYGRQCDWEEFDSVFQRNCCPRLEELRLASVRFANHGLETALLQFEFPCLRSMAVSGTDEGSLSHLLCMASIQALFSSRTLEKIVLFSIIFNDEDTSNILQALQSNTTIQEASLGITCGAQSGSALAAMLQNNTRIQKLWVRMNSVEDDTQNRRIAEAVRTASSLRELGLYGDGQVARKSQNYFLDALREDNTQLKELDLQGAEECEELNDLLFLNRLGRRELLLACEDRQLWIHALVNARHHLSCLFFLIHANPTVCSWALA